MRKLNQEYKDLANNFNFFLTERYKYYEPFEIELKFDIGRLGNSFLFFDSTISHYTFYYVLKEKFFNLSADFDERLHIEIPVQKKFFDIEGQNHFHYGDREYFYLCGGIFNIPSKLTYMCKRTEEPVIPLVKEKRIRTSGGPLKNYKLPIAYDDKKTYLIKGIGDIEILEKIFYEKCNIGKKSAIGFGQCKLNIKSINKLELFDNETRSYIRPIPVKYLNQKRLPVENTIESVFRPPYYGIKAKYLECGI